MGIVGAADFDYWDVGGYGYAYDSDDSSVEYSVEIVVEDCEASGEYIYWLVADCVAFGYDFAVAWMCVS